MIDGRRLSTIRFEDEGASDRYDLGGHREDMLRAMLRVAEDELRAKDTQIDLMQNMLATTEEVRWPPHQSDYSPSAIPHSPSFSGDCLEGSEDW